MDFGFKTKESEAFSVPFSTFWDKLYSFGFQLSVLITSAVGSYMASQCTEVHPAEKSLPGKFFQST